LQRGHVQLPDMGATVRRELVYFALGTMDVCVITPLYAALLNPVTKISPWTILALSLAAVITVHYLARLSFALSINSRTRSVMIAVSILISGLLAVHRVLYAPKGLWSGWLANVIRSLRRNILSPDIVVFLLVAFLWWRGLVLAQRRLDSSSVAFRFRLGVVLLAITTGIAGSMRHWPYHHLVFLFFFASLLGVAIARAEEVGQQYGGRQASFNMGWLTAMAIVSAVVLALAAGLTSLLTGKTLGRVLSPVLGVLQLLVFVLVYALAWVAQLILDPLLMLFQRYDIGRALADILDHVTLPEYPGGEERPGGPALEPEQLATIRVLVAILGAAVVLLLIAFSLYRLRGRSTGLRDEERESVWESPGLQPGLENLLERGRRGLRAAGKALVDSRISHLFAALTIRRTYALMAHLAATRGYPRPVDATPYDYVPALRKAFPDSVEEIRQITDAYVRVHYGEFPEEEDDLAKVRSAWKQIRQRASPS